MKYVNTQTGQLATIYDIRLARPDVSFPDIASDSDLAPFGYAVVQVSPPPEVPSDCNLEEAPPQLVDGVWHMVWAVTPKNDIQLEYERKAAINRQIRELENSITSRRLREAVLTGDNSFIASVDAQIAALRANL